LQQASTDHDCQEFAKAVALFDQVVDLAGRQGGPNYPVALINLISALLVQAEECDFDAALDKALHLIDCNCHLFIDHPLRLAYLGKRGRALLMKAQRTGDLVTMRQAVQTYKERRKMAPRGHPKHGECMHDLGVSLIHCSVMADSPSEVDEAVAVLTALKRRPDSSVDRAAVMSSLGNARLNRFLQVTRHDPADLVAALEEHAAAVEAMAPGDPNAATYLSDLGAAQMRAYEHSHDREAAVASVARNREAVDATSDRHVRKAERLANLASALLMLHESTGDPQALDEAVTEFRAAVWSTAPDHAHRARCLYGLATALFRRGELRGMLFDFDEAAVLAGQAVDATPDGHANMPSRLAFYAGASCSVGVRSDLAKADGVFSRASDLLRHDHPALTQIQSNHGVILEALSRDPDSDPSEARRCATEAVRLTRAAVDTTPLQHSEYIGRLLNFACASATWARLTGDVAVLGRPLDLCRAFRYPAGLQPDTLLELARAHALNCRYDLTEDAEAAAGAIEAYQHVAGDSRRSTTRRLNAACRGADLADRTDATGPGLSLYTLAIELLDAAAWRGMHRRDQERLLAEYGRLPSNAAAMAVTAGRPESAIEFLERGRGVLLDRLIDDSADLALLNEVDPVLTGQFKEIRDALDDIALPDVDADVIDLPVRPAHQRSEADERSALACQLDRLIDQIRATPRCGALFRAPSFADLCAGIGARSVVAVNVGDYRCDALSITPAGLRVIPLLALTRQDAEDAAEFFRDQAENAQRAGPVGWNARQQLTTTLAWLWDVVAEPVLRDVGMTGEAPADGEAPRLYWCPTGPAVFLPLHAAGYHADVQPLVPRTVIDHAESSYIPKLRVLASPHQNGGDTQQAAQRPLIVSMPATPGGRPLPGAQAEADHLFGLFPEATHLTGSAATRDAVLTALRSHTWFHFALHGLTDDRTPTAGGLELYDGRLTIRDLSEQRLPEARFAFLSACATYQGSSTIPDEAVTFGGALLVAGCENVVATLWPVWDDHATDMMQRLYGHIVAMEDGIACLQPHATAQALRETARALRDCHPDQPDRWAAFVHTASN